MRLLVAARLSQVRKGQTGIDTQDMDARSWGEANGHTIVAVVADKISGRVSPFKRPNLGPWLTDPKLMTQYDGVLGSKMDRLTRGRDWHTREWAEEKGKKLVLASPPLIWPPEPGDMTTTTLWDLLVNLASNEWENTSQRYRRMQRSLRDSNYLVGRPVWGFQVAPIVGTEHSTITPKPQLVPYLLGMVDRALQGDTLSSIAAWLDSEGMPPVRGGHWSAKSVSQVLRNESLAGRRRQGNSILRHQGVIDLATHKRLVAKLDRNPKRRGPVSSDPAMLTGVLHCGICNRIMHRRRLAKKRKDGSKYVYHAYRCDGTPRQPSTCRNMIPVAEIETWVNDWFTEGPFAEYERLETVVVPGNGYQDALDQNRRDIADLDIDNIAYQERLAELLAERAKLRSMPAEPDQVTSEFTGTTVREYWQSLTTAGLRTYMLNSGIKIYATRDEQRIEPTDMTTLWWPND